MPSPALNVAPSPSPVALSAPAPADGAPAIAGQSTEPSGQQAQPFAAVLQRQIHDQAAAKSAPKGVDSLLLASNTTSDQATLEQPQPDALTTLSALAPMLAGIVQPQQMPKEVEKKTDTDETATTPILLATPVVPTAPAVLPATPERGSESASAEQPLDLGASLRQTANLAGEVLQNAVSHADSGKDAASHESFESLLAAPKDLSSMLAAGQAAGSAATASLVHNSAPAATHVENQVGTPAWNGEIGDKLVWMSARHESRAELVLNPPQLGRLEISLSMNGDQASAIFVSANPNVRDALENAVPRLREILQDAGISLGQAQVGAESFGQPSNRGENGDNQARGFGRNEDSGLLPASFAAGAPTQWARQGNGLVDTFA